MRLLQEVDVSWLREQTVEFFLCDQYWVKELAEAKGGNEQRYQAIITAALEADVELRSMDWAVQCFIEGFVINAHGRSRYLVTWPHRGKGSSGTKKVSPHRYPEEMFWFKYGSERYEVGDVVKIQPPPDSSNKARHTSPGSGKRPHKDTKVQYGKIKKIAMESAGDKCPTIWVQTLEQSNPEDGYELSQKAGETKMDASRLKGKIVLLDRINYFKYHNYTIDDRSVFHRPSLAPR